MKQENKGDIFPMHETVKHTIFNDFELLKKYSSKIRVSKKDSEINNLLLHYKETYLKFYLDINDEDKIKKMTSKEQNILNSCYKNINLVTKIQIGELTNICRKVIHILGITKIEMKDYSGNQEEHLKGVGM